MSSRRTPTAWGHKVLASLCLTWLLIGSYSTVMTWTTEAGEAWRRVLFGTSLTCFVVLAVIAARAKNVGERTAMLILALWALVLCFDSIPLGTTPARQVGGPQSAPPAGMKSGSVSHGDRVPLHPGDAHDALAMAWDRVLELLGREIMKGYATVDALAPLAEHGTAAAWLARRESRSDDYTRRKIGATLAGLVRAAEPSLLDDLFEAERARDAASPPDSEQRLETQSVVEDIVFSAIRWTQNDQLRPSGVSLLQKVVERTLDGEYWNTSSYAMTGLVNCQAEAVEPVLARFRAFAAGEPPRHPSRPSLTQERTYAQGLTKRDPRILESVTPPGSEGFDFTAEDRRALDALLAAAKALDTGRPR